MDARETRGKGCFLKATVVRGVTLRPGSVVYHVPTYQVHAVLRLADPDSQMLESYAPAIEAQTIAATNGVSFAFHKMANRLWAWARNPENFQVTREEAEAELARVRSTMLDRAEKMLLTEEGELAEARAEAIAAQGRVERLRASVAALKDGTHPALHYARGNGA